MVCVTILLEKVSVLLSLVDLKFTWFEETLKRTLIIFEDLFP